VEVFQVRGKATCERARRSRIMVRRGNHKMDKLMHGESGSPGDVQPGGIWRKAEKNCVVQSVPPRHPEG